MRMRRRRCCCAWWERVKTERMRCIREALRKLREMSRAETRGVRATTRQVCVQTACVWSDDAADTLMRDWNHFISFYRCSTEHWVHLRTHNPLESVFSAVRFEDECGSSDEVSRPYAVPGAQDGAETEWALASVERRTELDAAVGGMPAVRPEVAAA